MKTKTIHTSGPWYVAMTGAIYSQRNNDYICPRLCSINLARAENDANAALIAAAPELLAALKNALTVIENEWPEDCLPETVKGYRAIIAKVEGKNEPE